MNESNPQLPPSNSIKVLGESLVQLPQDLYIPPEALSVVLEAFEGPLDLLLYLIKRENINILDIPIAQITHQYLQYIELMQELKMELAAEYLVMAAMLAEIKSRLLLPTYTNEEGEEIDPRAELVKRLQEYEQYKSASEAMDRLPRQGRDTFVALAETSACQPQTQSLPQLDFRELVLALQEVLQRASWTTAHSIRREVLSVRERMVLILEQIRSDQFIPFHQCFDLAEGRLGVIVTFAAILELIKESAIEVVQSGPLGLIHIRSLSSL